MFVWVSQVTSSLWQRPPSSPRAISAATQNGCSELVSLGHQFYNLKYTYWRHTNALLAPYNVQVEMRVGV